MENEGVARINEFKTALKRDRVCNASSIIK